MEANPVRIVRVNQVHDPILGGVSWNACAAGHLRAVFTLLCGSSLQARQSRGVIEKSHVAGPQAYAAPAARAATWTDETPHAPRLCDPAHSRTSQRVPGRTPQRLSTGAATGEASQETSVEAKGVKAPTEICGIERVGAMRKPRVPQVVDLQGKTGLLFLLAEQAGFEPAEGY
jgi:hypothetical protein